jgi:type IV pilus assembly protein PilV
MIVRRRRPAALSRGGQAGFTLIEVMIAVLVMGLGLLGFAMLQTMNVRFTKSAQQRTVAVMLAYEVIDMMRLQRSDSGLGAYNSVTFDSFKDVTTGNCARDENADIANNIARWKCEVRTGLPEGEANIALNRNTGSVTVQIRWGDSNWDADDPDTTFRVDGRI